LAAGVLGDRCRPDGRWVAEILMQRDFASTVRQQKAPDQDVYFGLELSITGIQAVRSSLAGSMAVEVLTTDRPTPSRREEVKREAPGQGGVRAGGFEPPRVAPPGPKLRTWCAGRCSPDLDQAFKQGGRRSVVPPSARSSRGVAARPVSNLVSIGATVPSGRGRLRRSRSSATRDRSAGRARQGRSKPGSSDPLLPKPDQLGCRPGLMGDPAAQRALPLTVNDRGIPLPAVLTGTWMARVDDLAASRQR
jgi:hypothetical protein